jgi:hypothetical protein
MRAPKRIILSLAGLMLTAGTALGAAAPAGAAQASPAAPAYTQCSIVCPTGQIINYGSGECIAPVPDSDLGYDANGLDIEQFSCAQQFSPPQEWIMVPLADAFVNGQTRTVYTIENLQSQECLDDRDGRTSDRSPVQQWTCNGTSTTMQWVLGDSLDGARQVMNLRAWQNGGSSCLDVAGGSLQDGAALQLYHCTAQNTAQHFFVPGNGE